MTPVEATQVLAYIDMLWPPRVALDAESVRMRVAAVADLWEPITQDEARAAIKSFAVEGGAFPPSVAQVLRHALDNRIGEYEDGDEVWGEVLLNIARCGRDRFQATSWSSSELRDYVERFGWRDICNSENLSVTQSVFMKGWAATVNRERASTMRKATNTPGGHRALGGPGLPDYVHPIRYGVLTLDSGIANSDDEVPYR